MADRSAPCGCDESQRLRVEIARCQSELERTRALMLADIVALLARLDAMLEDTRPPLASDHAAQALPSSTHLANFEPAACVADPIANPAELTNNSGSKPTDVQLTSAAERRHCSPQRLK